MKDILLDVILFVLFVAQLSFHFMPMLAHEILGVAMAIALILHIWSHRRTLISFMRNITPQKLIYLIVIIDMICFSAAVSASGVCMSNYLFKDSVSFELRRNMTIHQLHVSIPYILMALFGLHIGASLRRFWHRLLHLLGAEKFYQRWKIFFLATAVILSTVGVEGFFLNQVGDRVLMKHIFATPATELPAALFVLLIIGGMTFFAMIGFTIIEKFFRGRT